MKTNNVEITKTKRVITPTVIQMEMVECGAASLAIILGYHGKIIPLEQLRIDCGISRDGSKASNILKAARKYGLIAKGYRYEMEELYELKLPIIVFWNFNHFLVVEGFGKNCIYLNDPSFGPRTVSYEEFSDSYTGVTLTFETGPDFEKGGEKPNIFKSLGKRLKGSEWAIVYAILTGLALVFPAMVIPIFTKFFLDYVLIRKMNKIIGALIIGMIIAGSIRAILTWLQQHYLLKLEIKLSLSNSSKFLWHILRLPAEFFTQRFAGDISSRVAINDRFAQLLSQQLAINVLNFIMSIIYLILLFQYDIVLTLIALFIALINIFFLKFISRKRKDGNIRLLQDRGKLVGTSISGLNMIETLKSSGTEDDFYKRWSGYFAKLSNTEQELNIYTQYLSVVPTLLSTINTVLILAIGSIRIINGHMSIGTLIAYQTLMVFFMDPVIKLVNLGSTLQEVEGDMTRIDDVLRYKTDKALHENVDMDTTEDTARKLSGRVELKDITFGYSPLEPPLIENFSFSINPGSRIALVGTSGSGKSTIGKLICGVYKPWSGEILFDNKPVEDINRKIITNSLSVVDQNILLFEGTVKENITLWDASIKETSIIQSAKDASIHDEITSRDKGYDGIVEEGGRNFSGGQAQRLEIARSLATNQTILVLDEATSALDPLTEEHIDRALRRRGCSCIIVAHRLSTIRDCEEIIVLEKGKIVQRGTHEDLKDIDGPYRNLIKMY